MPKIIQVALANLRPGAKAKGGSIDSRKTDSPIDGLTASIAQHGLIVPLLVRTSDVLGIYDVWEGNRRLRALQALAKTAKGAVEAPCIVHEDGNALELSEVVNTERADLHPVDSFEVFSALVQSGMTVDELAKRKGMKVAQVRQALSLGRMAPEVREAWRAGKIGADTAEAFTLTSDHKAQAAALKKAGSHASLWSLQRILLGDSDDYPSIQRMLKIVGRDDYVKAGHTINASLFSEREDLRDVVSDIGALKRMVDDKIEAKCEALREAGWKWAIAKKDQPKDAGAWRRSGMPHNATKEQKASAGCIVDFDHGGDMRITYGIIKPGDKVSIPKPAKQKKAEAKKRAEHKEQTGGISNALAFRLSKQLTAGMREAVAEHLGHDEAIVLAIAALACAGSMFRVSLPNGEDQDARYDNDFQKYVKLVEGKSRAPQLDLLAHWLSRSIDLTAHAAENLLDALASDEHGTGARLVAASIDENDFRACMLKHFDAKDYFASVSKQLIVEAVAEAMSKEHAAKVAKMTSGEAAKFATANVKAWLPHALRLAAKPRNSKR